MEDIQNFSGDGTQPPSPLPSTAVNQSDFVTIQEQDIIMQSFSDYFNVSKFCLK